MRAKLRGGVALILGFLVVLGMVSIVRARRAVQQARVDIATATLPFEMRPVSQAKPESIDFLPTAPDFRDAQIFHDSLYTCGSGGVWVYDLGGALRASYLVGRDLPPSPPVAMTVGSVAGDAAPRLWIATADAGILIFDGTQFAQLHIQPKAYGSITSLLMLPVGELLIGFSEGGVVSYNGSKAVSYHPDLRNIPITALAGDEGDLWIGTRDRGVIHWTAGGGETFDNQNGLSDNRVLSLAVLDDRVFVGTPLGPTEFKNGKPVGNLAEGVFSQTMLAEKDRLVVGTVDQGIINVALANERISRFAGDSDLEPRTVRRIFGRDGSLFALTADALYEQSGGSGTWLRRINAGQLHFTDRDVAALSIDPQGDLWIGYFDHGLDIGPADGAQAVNHVEDDEVFCVNRIVYDAGRQVTIVATANGIAVLSPQGKILRRITETDGLISAHVTDVAVRPEGLAAATAAGVTLFNSSGAESIYAFNGLVNNHVYALGLNGSQLLVGTLGGLSVIQDGLVRASYTTANSPLKQNWISAVVPVGNSWFIGTYGAGVIQLNGDGKWIEFPDFPSHVVINPNAMLAIPGHILAGSLDHGLFNYDTAAQRWTTFSDGLPSLNVTALAATPDKLVVGTDNGIVRMPLERVLQ